MEYVEGSIIIHAINNGKLIKDENCSKIFEPMFSTYSDGTGLGLTIIQDTIVSYQGSISLESNKPDTHFKLVIPRREAPEEEVK
jgi:nitrogen-specific signal transduction histidine kinase